MTEKNITPLRTALIFALFGALWIILSDRVLEYFVPAVSSNYITFQTIKGWLFVLASASLIFLILRRDLESLAQKQQHIAYQAGLINDVSDALISTDMQFKIVSWNSAAEKIYGWQADEVIGQNLNDSLKMEYPQGENYETAFQKLMEQGYLRSERINSRKDGTRFPVLSSISFIRDEKGGNAGFVIVNRDITENKQARELLLQQSRQLALLSEASQKLNHSLNVNEIYDTVSDFMSTIAPNDQLVISGFDPQTQLIACLAFKMDDTWQDVSEFPPIPLEAEGKGTQSIVIRTGEPLLLNDYQAQMKTAETSYYFDDETHELTAAQSEPEGDVTRSALIVPLKISGQVRGVLQVLSFTKNAYTENQLKLLESLSLHIASAWQNALLYTQMQVELGERIQAEKALLQSEERFQKAFRSGPVGLSITRGADGVYLDANDAFSRIVGFSHEELVGNTSLGLKITTPEQRERYTGQIRDHHLIYTEEMTLRSKSGEFRTVLGSMEVIELNHEPCVLSTAIDITERKQMENALRLNEMRFRSLIENGLDNISMLDAEGKLLWESPSTIRTLGYGQDAYKGRNIFELIHPDDAEWVGRQFQEILAQPRVAHNGTFRIHHLDGSWRWIESIGTNLLDEPSVNAIVINYRDITEKKTTEETLGKTEQKWSSLVKTIPDYIALFDKDNRYLFLNHYAEGYSEKDVIGRHNADFLPNESRDGYLQSFEKARQTGQTQFVEYQGYGDLGSLRYYDSYFTPIFENGEFANMLVLARDITERKQAEELQKQSDQRYRLLFENMPIAIWEEDFSEVKEYLNSLKQQGVTDFRSYFEMHPDAVVECAYKIRILDVNAAAVTMYEAENKEELITDTNEDVNKAEIKNIHEVLIALADGITSGGWEDMEETLTGKPIEISLNWSVVPGYDQDYSGVIVTTIDITERKLAEEAIRESNEILRAILNASTESVFVMDSNGIVLAGNEMTAARFEKSLSDMIGANIYDFLPPDVAEARKKRADNVFRERKPAHFEDERFGVWIENSLYPIFESDGQVKRIAVYGRDVTERKRTESRDRKRTHAFELLAKGASLSAVLEAIIAIVENDFKDALCSILLLDESKQHLLHGAALRLPEFFNQAIHGQEIGMGNGSCGTAAYTGQRVIVEDIETHPYWEKYRDLARRAGLRASWSQPILSSSGEVLGTFAIYHVQPSTPRAEELEAVLNVANLASVAIERKHAEETIREYAATLEQRVEQRTAELIHANRAKDEFLANMSHELRTPLNSVLGFSEMLLEGVRGSLNDRQSQALQMIRGSGEHLLGLINDILDVSKIEAGKFEIRIEPAAVNDICQSSLSFIKQLSIKKSILVEYSSSPVASTILVDPKRLKQILVNLLNNAVKFTPEKGKVSLGVLADPERGQMRFSVTDTGIGIAPDDLEKLFKPFIQVDSSLSRQYEGTGLGLILVKRLVEMHGGTVEVESTVGVGSVFTVILPWDQNTNAADNKNDEQIRSVISESTLRAHGKVKILLAEDNEANVMVVGDYLKNHGYQVYVAHHGGEALVMAAELSPHLILMDIQMPEMDGLEAIRRLRTEPATAAVPIIALTAFAMPGDRERCLEAGANDYLSKPFKLSVLQQAIDAILNRPAE